MHGIRILNCKCFAILDKQLSISTFPPDRPFTWTYRQRGQARNFVAVDLHSGLGQRALVAPSKAIGGGAVSTWIVCIVEKRINEQVDKHWGECIGKDDEASDKKVPAEIYFVLGSPNECM